MAGDVRNPRFLLPKLDKNKAECQPNFFFKTQKYMFRLWDLCLKNLNPGSIPVPGVGTF